MTASLPSPGIFALASGAGRSAVAVVRLSGSGCGEAVGLLAGGLPPPRRASLRRLTDPGSGEVLDHALVLWFPGPASYTGEDAAELQLHGGPAVLAAVLDALAGLGLRPAEPGEFTRRAFLRGRMELTEAEGIADLIAAETEAQRRQALRQVAGGLAARCAAWSVRLTRLLARQEAFIEFETEDLPPGLAGAIAADAAGLAAEFSAAAAAPQGERLREGITIAILGAPNAGKSSLLNALVKRDAAIVAATPGTTRDVIEARLVLAGIPATIADTAGLRATDDPVEAEGIRRARLRADAADLILALFATDQAPDAATLGLLGPATIGVATKIDLGSSPKGLPLLGVSARTGAGLEALQAQLEAAATRLAGMPAEAALTRPRHRAAIREAAQWLDRIAQDMLPELRAEALRAALGALGRVTGRVGVEQVLDEVFGEFCIGK